MSIVLESCVLVVAGSDSGAGAGIQADLKSCSALGVYATTAITAITAQNTCGVRGIEPVTPEMVAAQMRAVLEDFNVAVVKIGMLGSGAVVEAVVGVLDDYPELGVVLDPVLISTSGAPLLDATGVATLRRRLLPRSLLVTPNLSEIALLAGMSEDEVCTDRENAARRLLESGVGGVLVKGGHLPGSVAEDLLFYGGECVRFVSPRIDTSNSHGTGCTLAAAIAAGLALGQGVPDAVRAAKRYLDGALLAGRKRRLGRGCGPLAHGFASAAKES